MNTYITGIRWRMATRQREENKELPLAWMQIEAGASKSSRNPVLCVSGKQRNLSPRSAVEWKTRKRGSEGQQEGEGGGERERERDEAVEGESSRGRETVAAARM